MNRTLLAYMLAAIISFSTVATITMQPYSQVLKPNKQRNTANIIYTNVGSCFRIAIASNRFI
ncbi:MAG TPA: hypothetical protein VJ697_05665 [Nitrososphaeraceae archaeon]|nr:hypothetical protein [Nitrososphaeraceae archaeon]